MKKIVCQGKTLTLADKEFLASGGQGDIYLHAGFIYKIYHDAMPQDLVKKITELTVLVRPNIIRPLDVVYHATNSQPIGYTMDYADNTIGMPLLFTTSYLTRNNIKLSDIQELVKEMSETISFIHSKKILIVDGNELNYLVDKSTYHKPYFIDVDSYATPSSPASVIMPSVRDYATKGFSELTDWYSYAVVTFQLFTGIHPYKGKHALYKTVEERCKNHISVFNKDVSTPPAIRDFNGIPSNYRQWYEEIFEKGLRTPPPSVISAVQAPLKRKYVSSTFNIEKVFQAEESIYSVEWLFGIRVIITENFIYLGDKKYSRHNKHSVVALSSGTLFEAWFTKEGLQLCDIRKTLVLTDPNLRAAKWFSISGRLYSIYESQLFELDIRTFGTNVTAVVAHTQPIAQQSSQIFTNIVYANILGKAFFYIPCCSKSVVVYPCPTLDGKKILDAREEMESRIIIAADPDGTVKRYRNTVGGDGSDFWEVEEISMQEINSTVLSNGIQIIYDSIEDTIDITNLSFPASHKTVQSAGLPQGASLTSEGTQAYYFADDSLYKFSMKAP